MVSESDGIVKYSVKIAPKAKEDLRKIYEFVREDAGSVYTASKQVEIIETGISSLSIFPNGCPKYEGSSHYRVCHIKKYCVIFSVDDDSHKVFVVHIFHAHQDIGSELSSK